MKWKILPLLVFWLGLYGLVHACDVCAVYNGVMPMEKRNLIAFFIQIQVFPALCECT